MQCVRTLGNITSSIKLSTKLNNLTKYRTTIIRNFNAMDFDTSWALCWMTLGVSTIAAAAFGTYSSSTPVTTNIQSGLHRPEQPRQEQAQIPPLTCRWYSNTFGIW